MKTTASNKVLTLTLMMLVLGWLAMSFDSVSQDKGKPWKVPDVSKQKKNPQNAAPESIAAGKTLYAKHCKSCHGTKGLGDGPKAKELDTDCGDFSTAAFHSQTDGELFYKTKEGRDDMPSFKKKIPDDEDIWNIVNYLRTLAK